MHGKNDGKNMIRIYHNPHCSKSREALDMVQQFAREHALPLEVIEYLQHPPDAAQLAQLLLRLDADARAIVRDSEEEYAALGLAGADDQQLLDAVARHPRLLQRPIVLYRDRALIARPPALLGEFLQP